VTSDERARELLGLRIQAIQSLKNDAKRGEVAEAGGADRWPIMRKYENLLAGITGESRDLLESMTSIALSALQELAWMDKDGRHELTWLDEIAAADVLGELEIRHILGEDDPA
jgi:ATP:corrinoid adenosyltransferase